jgi:Uma2 family endonuclease
MPRSVSPLSIPEPTPGRIRWTRSQCETIRAAGILTGRYELIDGEIISKMGQNPPHPHAINLVLRYLARVFGIEMVRVQATIEIGDADPEHNDPEPDLAVTEEPADAYSQRHPGPADLVLVVEVSDTTLRFDRGAKALLYARAGIREYWVLDLGGRALYVHRNPTPEGYAEISRYTADEQVAAGSPPEALTLVASLLPPPARN